MNLKLNTYKVTFRTVTPLYFGDAWMKNTVSRASSIMGSLRFWFEVICYFIGITTNSDYKGKRQDAILKAELDQKKFHENLLKHLKTSDSSIEETVDKVLAELDIPLPARIFGCTGWQGLIKIGEIKNLQSENIDFPLKKIGIPKDKSMEKILINNDCPTRSNEKYSVHYFPRSSVFGKFEINFKTQPLIAEHILFPLLKFVEEYGFIGGAWNSGFGRVSFETGEKSSAFTDYAEFANAPVEPADLVKRTSNIIELWEDRKSINTINLYQCNNMGLHDIADVLEELVREKVYLRRTINNSKERHLVFGTRSPSPQGSKVFPWIYKQDGDESKKQCGFISIAGILNIGQEEREGKDA